MNTPVPPEQGSVSPLYGRRRLSINRTVALVALAGLLGGAGAERSAPPLTELTQRSGGEVDADRASVAFDAADLAFEVLPEKQVLNGVATLTFSARAAINRLALDLDRDLEIESIAIDGRSLTRSAWSNPEGRLTIALPRPVPAGGKVTARIAYGGKPHVAVNAPWDDGMVWSKTPDGKTWFATTAEGYGCDLFWPCLDFPEGEPAVVTLHITVPAGLKAPSNGVLLGVETLPDGRTRWNWRARTPNTYAIALNVGPYEELSASYKSRFGNVIPLHFWYLPGNAAKAQALFAEFAPTLDFFESTIGPYPFGDEKVGVVETPHKGMEHQTINAYGNGYAKAPEGFDWLFHHELSHEWFGNQLTAANWDDYWLHEGFASYMQPLYGRWREGDARYAVMLETHRNHITNAAPIVRDRILTEEEVYEPTKGGAGTDIYYKAAWMLHTLRWLIGDAAFFEATRRMVYGRPDPKPGNFTPRFGSTREFEGIVARVTGRDYGWFFDAYLRQRALPELIVKRVGGALTLRWNTTAPFPMPIEVVVGEETRKVTLSGEPQTIAVGEDARVVVDPRALVLRRSVAVEAYQAGLARAK